MSFLQETKIMLVDTLGLSRDALHIYVGLVVFLLTAAVFRWKLSDLRPLAAVLLVALVGEAWDIYDTAQRELSQQYAGNWHDIRNTLFWPAVLFLLARFTGIFRR